MFAAAFVEVAGFPGTAEVFVGVDGDEGGYGFAVLLDDDRVVVLGYVEENALPVGGDGVSVHAFFHVGLLMVRATAHNRSTPIIVVGERFVLYEY